MLIIAIAVALWEHRRHLAEMRQQLAWSENTHDLLQAHALDVDTRLADLSATVQSRLLAGQQNPAAAGSPAAAQAPGSPAAPPAPTVANRYGSGARPNDGQALPRTTAHAGSAAAAMAAAQAAVTQQWIDTEPMVLSAPVPDIDPTLPVEASRVERLPVEPTVPDFDPTLPVEMSTH